MIDIYKLIILIWSRRQESNLYRTLRRHVFYPLNYGEIFETYILTVITQVGYFMIFELKKPMPNRAWLG